MEDAISAMELEFKRLGRDLEHVAHQLDASDVSINRENRAPNISQLMHKMASIEAKLSDMHAKVMKVSSLRASLIPQAASNLIDNQSALDKLFKHSETSLDINEELPESAEARSALESLFLMVTTGEYAKPAQPQRDSSETIQVQQKKSVAFAVTESEPETITKPVESSSTTATAILSEDAFNRVPLTIRGRVKYTAAVSLLQRLSAATDPKTKGAYLPITLADLEKIGFKVTGKTGDSLVATLRAMDRVTVTRSGLAYKPPIIQSTPPPGIRGGSRGQTRVVLAPVSKAK